MGWLRCTLLIFWGMKRVHVRQSIISRTQVCPITGQNYSRECVSGCRGSLFFKCIEFYQSGRISEAPEASVDRGVPHRDARTYSFGVRVVVFTFKSRLVRLALFFFILQLTPKLLRRWREKNPRRSKNLPKKSPLPWKENPPRKSPPPCSLPSPLSYHGTELRRGLGLSRCLARNLCPRDPRPWRDRSPRRKVPRARRPLKPMRPNRVRASSLKGLRSLV